MDEIIKMWEDKGFIVRDSKYFIDIYKYINGSRNLLFRIYKESPVRYYSYVMDNDTTENVRMSLKTMEFLEKEVL